MSNQWEKRNEEPGSVFGPAGGNVSNRKVEIILWVAVISMSLVSVYTTKIGLTLIFREGSFFSTTVVPWVFSVSLSLFLLFFSYRIIYQPKNEKVSALVIGYCFAAIVSIFFNFNAIYTSVAQTSNQQLNEKKLRNQLVETVSVIESQLNQELLSLQKKLDTAKRKVTFEARRQDRPGKGSRYFALQEEYEIMEAQLFAEIENLESLLNKVTMLGEISYKNKQDSVSIESEAIYRNQIIDAIIEAKGIAKARGIDISVTIERISPYVADVKTLEFSLFKMAGEASRWIKGEGDGVAFGRVVLSLLLGILVDLMPLIAIILSRPGRKRKKRILNKQSVDREELNNRLWGNSEV